MYQNIIVHPINIKYLKTLKLLCYIYIFHYNKLLELLEPNIHDGLWHGPAVIGHSLGNLETFWTVFFN